ncbi:glycerate kinase [Symbiobacterium terraclitae]|uniref:glycerate kinase n=1 Tax=Symbiobacterium terraclitae TaxID=557451 RepID=UPI0035B50C57
MKIILAPDSFKGSLTAVAAAEAMRQGVLDALPGADAIALPMADGGEGTVDALVAATGGRLVRTQVTGPLGDPVEAAFGLLGDGRTAAIEMAAASGLLLVPEDRRNPRVTTTYGTGELIRAALDVGVRRIIIGIGGSATNDGGVGMTQALGGRFLRADGTEVGRGGAALLELERIDLRGLDPRLARAELLVACDVDNPLTGPRGASAVYGPQKGAGPEDVALLDRALTRLADVAARSLGRDPRASPGAGAAGGLGYGLMAFLGAELRRGIDLVMAANGLDRLLPGAALVITGEGRTDGQTLSGKVVLGVARAAARHGVPAVVLSGAVTTDAERLLEEGVTALFSTATGPMRLEEAMDRAGELLRRAAAHTVRLARLGLGR